MGKIMQRNNGLDIKWKQGEKMRLKFLPLPIYIALCLFLCGLMIFFAITRRYKDRKGLIVIYITLAATMPFAIVGRTIQTYFQKYIGYYDLSAIIVFLILIFVFIDSTVMALNDYRKGKLKRQLAIGLCLGWPGIIFFVLILFHVI